MADERVTDRELDEREDRDEAVDEERVLEDAYHADKFQFGDGVVWDDDETEKSDGEAD